MGKKERGDLALTGDASHAQFLFYNSRACCWNPQVSVQSASSVSIHVVWEPRFGLIIPCYKETNYITLMYDVSRF